MAAPSAHPEDFKLEISRSHVHFRAHAHAHDAFCHGLRALDISGLDECPFEAHGFLIILTSFAPIPITDFVLTLAP
jgi:hypothetical protein